MPVASHRLKTPTPSLHPRSTQPVGLALFCQQSLSSHSTPPSHYSAADCSSCSHRGGSFNSRFCASALVQQIVGSPTSTPCFSRLLYLVEKGFPFSVLQGILIACLRSMFLHPNCGVCSLIDWFCVREYIIVYWVIQSKSHVLFRAL